MWNLGSWECKRKQRGIQVRIKYEKFMILQEWLYARKQQVGISAHSYFLFFPLPRESVPTCRSMSSSWHPPEYKVHACEKTPPLLGEKGIDVFVSLLESTHTHTLSRKECKKRHTILGPSAGSQPNSWRAAAASWFSWWKGRERSMMEREMEFSKELWEHRSAHK